MEYTCKSLESLFVAILLGRGRPQSSPLSSPDLCIKSCLQKVPGGMRAIEKSPRGTCILYVSETGLDLSLSNVK